MDLNGLLGNLFSANKPKSNKPCTCEHCAKKRQQQTVTPLAYPDTYLDGKKIENCEEPINQKENNDSSNSGFDMNMLTNLLPVLMNGGKNFDPASLLSMLGGGNNQNSNILGTLAQAFTNNSQKQQPVKKTKTPPLNNDKLRNVNDYIFE